MSDGHKQEFGTRLTLDDHASSTLEKIKHGFEHVAEHAREVQNEFRQMLVHAAGTAIGFQFNDGIESIKEFAHEAFEAAKGAERQQKELAGVLALSDKTGASMDVLRERSVGLHEELELVGIKAGQSGEAVMDAFELMAERSEKPQAELEELTKKMTIAGKALSGGVGSIAAGFRDMEAGIVRPKNAIVLLMKQTGVAAGSARQISKGLSAMIQNGQQEKVFALAEKAIDRMAEKMKGAKPTFAGTITALEGIRESLYKSVGTPMLQALTPPLQQLKGYFLENREEIEHWAHAVGEQVGDWTKEAAQKMKDGFLYVKNHAEEIKNALEVGAHFLKDAIEFAVANRAILTGINVVSTGMKVGSSVAAFGGKMAGMSIGGAAAAHAAGGVAEGAFAAGMGPLGVSATTAAAISAGIALASFAAAIASVSAAAYQGYELYQDHKADSDESMIKTYEDGIRHIYATHHDLTIAEMNKVDELEHKIRSLSWNDFDAKERIDSMIMGLEQANDEGMQFNKTWARDIEKSKGDINEMFKLYQEALAGGNQAALALLEPLIGPYRDAPFGEKPKGMTMDFRGSQFNIKQDFKDENPDRIAVMLKRDILNAAIAPTMATGASAHLGI